MSNKLITKRILKLLEYKNTNYKRKYFILSALSNTNIKNSKNKMLEVNCFIDSLNKSNGTLPKEDTIVKLYETCLKDDNDCNANTIDYIKGYVNMLFPENKNIVENIINNELSIANINFKTSLLNKKLKTTLIESIESKKHIFIETLSREEKLKRLKQQDIMLFGGADKQEELEPVVLDDDIDSPDSFEPDPKKLKTGYKGDKFDPDEPKKIRLSGLEKLGLDAAKKMKNRSVVAKRKFDIILQIQYYLNIQQKLDLTGIDRQGLQDLKKSRERFSFKASGLTEEELLQYRTHLDRILRKSKSNEPLELTLETDVITEKELVNLLKKVAGKQVSDAELYLRDLDVRMPIEKEIEDKDSDYDHEQYLADTKSFEEAQHQEDVEDYIKSNEYLSAEDAALSSELSRQEKLDRLKTISIEEYSLMSKEAKDNIPNDVVIKIFKQGLGHLSDAQRRKVEYERLAMLSASPEEWEAFTGIDKDSKDGRTSLQALQQLSRGRYSGVPGIRQNLQKKFSMAVWLSTDDDYKAEMYYAALKYYFRAVRELDLIEDKVIRDPQEDEKRSENIKRTFKEIEMAMTPETIKKYLKEDENIHISELDEMQMNIANALFSDITSYRIFVVSIFNDFYSSVVWSKWESDLAYSIKEYFEHYHPASNIGASFAQGMKSRDVLPSEGKQFFDTIINYAMGRTGLKSDAAFSIKPHEMKAMKREAFTKKIHNKINDFIVSKADATSLKQFTMSDANKLADDLLKRTGFIGSIVDEYKTLDEYWVDEFKLFLNAKNISFFTRELSKALFMNNWYQEKMPEVLFNNTFIGKNEEDNLKRDAIKAIGEWEKLNKKSLKKHRKDLAIEDDIAAKAITAKAIEREYKWLDLVDEVIYNNQEAEIKRVDFENQKVVLITDEGEIEVNITDVSPINK